LNSESAGRPIPPAGLAVAGQGWEGGCGGGGFGPPPPPAGHNAPQPETAGHACDAGQRPRPAARRQAAAYHRLSPGRRRRARLAAAAPAAGPASPGSLTTESETAAEAQAQWHSVTSESAGPSLRLAAAARPGRGR
jgi:hypothetical protein